MTESLRAFSITADVTTGSLDNGDNKRKFGGSEQ